MAKKRRSRAEPLTTRKKLILAAAVGLPILAVFTFSNRGLLKRVSLEDRHQTAQEQLLTEEAIADSLQAEIDLLEKDSVAVEKVARERYGMVRPGEQIYMVDEEE